MEKKKFCPLPWISQTIRNDGHIRVCSPSHSSPSKGLLKNNNQQYFNATDADLTEAFNSEELKLLRLSMLKNEDNIICTRCDQEETSGVRSRRISETENWSSVFSLEDAKKITNPDGSINSLPRHYDMRFGNKCNLKCRSCSPTDSSNWYDDYVKIWNTTRFGKDISEVNLSKQNNRWVEDNNKFKWYESDTFWEQLENRLDVLSLMHNEGGEPLLIDQHFTILEKCIEKGFAHKIVVEYNSNIVSIPDKAWELWKHFKKINIGASIDGIYEINDYIRHPSKFEHTLKNLKRLDETPDNFNIWITTTIQIYNAHHLPEFIKWVIKQKFKKIQRFDQVPILTCHPLHHPEFLNIKALPKDIKEWISQLYAECENWLDVNAKDYIDNPNELENTVQKGKELLRAYYDFMWSGDLSHMFPKFIKYTQNLDAVRSESIEKIMPDFYERIKKHLN